MALVAARGFSGGPMSDIDYGMVASSSAWVETAAALAVTQPNTGTRSVSIAAGWHDGFGIRQNNDAAITQALAAPGSGGAWYLLALRRDWAAKTCTLVVLAGATTGSTAAPTTIPTAAPTDLKSTPGGQHDQPLAWAFVNSANTTVTLFDLRLIDNGGRTLTAATMHALAALGLFSAVKDGALFSLGSGLILPNSTMVDSVWQWRTSGAVGFRPVGRIRGSSAGVLTDLTAYRSAGYPLSLNDGDEVLTTDLGKLFRYNGSAWVAQIGARDIQRAMLIGSVGTGDIQVADLPGPHCLVSLHLIAPNFDRQHLVYVALSSYSDGGNYTVLSTTQINNAPGYGGTNFSVSGYTLKANIPSSGNPSPISGHSTATRVGWNDVSNLL